MRFLICAAPECESKSQVGRRHVPSGWFIATISTNAGGPQVTRLVQEPVCSLRCLEDFVHDWTTTVRKP